MWTLGVDPGAGGALALLKDQGVRAVYDMPTVLTDKGRRRVDAFTLRTLFDGFPRFDRIVVEAVHAMPRDGVAGSFWFGKAAGIIEGVVAGLDYDHEHVVHVTPQVWKRRLDVPAMKGKAIERATKLFGSNEHWTLKKHDGRAEAAMLALWGYMDMVAGRW